MRSGARPSRVAGCRHPTFADAGRADAERNGSPKPGADHTPRAIHGVSRALWLDRRLCRLRSGHPRWRDRSHRVRTCELRIPRRTPARADRPRSYSVRFRLAGVSDDRQVNVPPDEWTIATCEEDIDVFDQEAVNIAVTFDRDSCVITATYTVTIIY